ncbi:putative monooxygenase [Nocardioides baekrokdamisoli]|uniref:Putative monooxygenase n=1 Tax=Nocardioides baekrokdamisoli TaxID=1804624 RepID=A0A3G9ITH4_9ACTN|nr:NAD(P)/FAD-dependent oxidoreductase [Nocardioides baekrokdamisoli]BBH16931.1 putative monooxygenase [Nocardioides baekrokdamisoli]
MTSQTNTRTHDAVIVGAGFGGMGAAIQLQRSGFSDIVILEREDDLGGTWHVNRYPGLAVDIPSPTYSYSFEPNPYWTRLFAPGAELKAYATHVAEKYDLTQYMRFGQSVESATWDEKARRWTVRTSAGDEISATFLITATGFLSQPKMPDIKGIESFKGKVIHTADWDDSYDLTGKRVALIGTGATAVQLIPTIADRLKEFTVYQRTAIWVSPKMDAAIPGFAKSLFARLPLSQRAVRLGGTSILEVLMVAGVLHYGSVPAANKLGEALCRAHLRREVKDKDLRAKLTPDYSFGCKRPTFSNTFYKTFATGRARLETTPIDHVEKDGIVTVDGHKTEIDVLICATGFDIWETNFPALEIIGKGGRNLGEWWRSTRFQSYEGIALPSFPNFFSLNSPYSYSGLSYFTTVEAQMKHMARLLAHMDKRGASTFEVTEEANDAFMARMTENLQDSVFAQGSCATSRSYYFTSKGETPLLRATSTINAFREAGSFPLTDYAFA